VSWIDLLRSTAGYSYFDTPKDVNTPILGAGSQVAAPPALTDSTISKYGAPLPSVNTSISISFMATVRVARSDSRPPSRP